MAAGARVKSRTRGRWAAIAASAVVAVSFVCCRDAAPEAAYPVERARRTFADHVWTRIVGVFRGAESRAENVRLRREVAALSLVREDAARLERENARLREALGYGKALGGDWCAAEVLSRDGAAAGVARTVRVASGSLNGLRTGAVVTSPEGLVGRVSAVTPHTAEVTLLIDGSVKVACEIERLGANPVRGILSGGDGAYLTVRHLTGATTDVPARARVVTSGLGGVFPRGLEIGTLVSLRRADGAPGPSDEAEVLPSVDFSTLDDVFIRHER